MGPLPPFLPRTGETYPEVPFSFGVCILGRLASLEGPCSAGWSLQSPTDGRVWDWYLPDTGSASDSAHGTGTSLTRVRHRTVPTVRLTVTSYADADSTGNSVHTVTKSNTHPLGQKNR